MNAQATSLKTIASWRIPQIATDSEITASIPALQRGLVWKAQHIELLWDSILRGFPIGSLVVCENIKSQERANQHDSKYHLLDGQQRSHAISLGFEDPTFQSDDTSSILWLDLSPEKIGGGSTRQYLTRLTKMAHPWGYQNNDEASRLPAGEIWQSLSDHGYSRESFSKDRPNPGQLKPVQARFPIPLSFFLYSAEELGGHDIEKFRSRLIQRLKCCSQQWALDARTFLKNDTGEAAKQISPEQLSYLLTGATRALDLRIVLLEVPSDLMEATRQENQGETEIDGIANIEHLFQRLNRQGTALSTEELAYSMIKAYLPEVADTVENIHPLRMAPSRLVHLAVRSALSEIKSTDAQAKRLVKNIPTTRLRKIAQSRTGEEYHAIFESLGTGGSIVECCRLIDSWLLYQENKTEGLPPFLLSNIALKNPELFLLLLSWASRFGKEGTAGEEVAALFPGIASLIHWFGKPGLCDRIFELVQEELSLSTLLQAFQTVRDEGLLNTLHTPDEFETELEMLKPTSDQNSGEWNFWTAIVAGEREEKERHKREASWWHLFSQVLWNRDFVVYAQRKYLNERFSHFDQANLEMWEDHNRPWDYDHILPRVDVINKRSANVPFKKICGHWVNTNGNFWACPFEDNRSFGKGAFQNKAEFLDDMFVTEDEVEGFSSGWSTISSEETAFAFCGSVRKRTARVYREWYEATEISRLLDTPSNLTS